MTRAWLFAALLLLTACRASWSDQRLQCAPPTDACFEPARGGTVSLFRMPFVPRFGNITAMETVAAAITGVVIAVFGAGIVVGWLTGVWLRFMALALMGGA